MALVGMNEIKDKEVEVVGLDCMYLCHRKVLSDSFGCNHLSLEDGQEFIERTLHGVMEIEGGGREYYL